MRKALVRGLSHPLALGLLLAAVGFSFAWATRDADGRAAVIPPNADLPDLSVITGADSSKQPAYFDLGTVVVGVPFTRLINVRDGFPPYTFKVVRKPPNCDLLLVDATSGLVTATFQAPTPSVQPPPVALTGSALPQAITFDVLIKDKNPDPAFIPPTVTFGVTAVAVNQTGIHIENATNVITPTTINPGAQGNPVPTGYPSASTGASLSDLPSALQQQPYNYQFHGNGGARTGGAVDVGTFTPINSTDPSNDPSALVGDTTSIFAGSNDGDYTLTVQDTDSSGFPFDLVVTSSTDSGLNGAKTQTFLNVPNGSLAIGSLGVRVTIQNRAAFHLGDFWKINVTGLPSPNTTFSLVEDTPALPDGLRLDDQGLLSGTPSKAGDFTFLVRIVDNADPFLAESTRQFFIRVLRAPVSSQFVIVRTGFKLNFGRDNSDSMNFDLFINKDVLRDFSQLSGASFEMIVGDPQAPMTLTSFVTGGKLEFGAKGGIDWPPQLKQGEPENKYAHDARVFVNTLDANSGYMRLRVDHVPLVRALKANSIGTAGILQVPITINIIGGGGSLNLQLDEVVTFEVVKTKRTAFGRIPKGPQAATFGIGQFLIAPASGSIIFDTQTGSDTLALVLKGFMRTPDRVALDPIAITPNARIHLFLGAQCAYEGTVSDLVVKGAKVILTNPDPLVPLASFVLDNRTGTFKMILRAPATNAARIEGIANPGVGTNPGLVIDAVEAFTINVRLRIFDNRGTASTLDDQIFFDGLYPLQLFRTGNTLGLK